MLYNARNNAIDFFNEYVSRASEAKHQAKKGTGCKILTLKQMLQILPIALAQIKTGNNSESLLKKITDCLPFVSIKRNYQKSILQHN